MKRGLLVVGIIAFLFFWVSGAQGQSQTVTSGQTTTPINFPIGCSYNWTNSAPGDGLGVSGTGDILPFIAVNTGTMPLVVTIQGTPLPTEFAYIANSVPGSDGTVSVINTVTNTVVSTITVGSNPWGVTASANGTRVYVSNVISNSVSVIDATVDRLITNIPVGLGPEGIVVSPDEKTVYVGNSRSSSISVIDAATNSVTAPPITLPGHPYAIAISPDGSKLYVTLGENSVSVISTATNTIIANISLAGTPGGVVVSPDGTKAYVTVGANSNIAVINTITNTVSTYIPTDIGTGLITISPDGSTVYASNQKSIFVINAATNTVIATIPGLNPTGLSVTSNGSRVYVDNEYTNIVSVIDAASNSIISSITVGGEGGISIGNFISSRVSCAPYNYTITILPSPPPVITPGLVTGKIVSCAGTPSSSPNIQQFTVSGSNLLNDITVAAPVGFEVSLTPGGGYANSVTIPQTRGTVSNVPVYVRSSVGALPGNNQPGTVLLSSGIESQPAPVSETINPIPDVYPVGPVVYTNGDITTPITFTGISLNTTYTWTSDNNSIGLITASGTNVLPSFTAKNTGTTNIVANIKVTPQYTGGCPGNSTSFTITVKPTPTSPTIVASDASGVISACVGTVSADPYIQEITVSGIKLNSGIIVSVPGDLEVSLNKTSGYGSSLPLLQSGGNVSPTLVYIRSSNTAVAGILSERVTITSPGATTQTVPVSGIITALPSVNTFPHLFYTSGQSTTPYNFTGNANIFTWKSDNTAIGIAASGAGDISSFTAKNNTNSPITATINVTPDLKALGYVANDVSSNVTVFNTITNTKIQDIDLTPGGGSPLGVAITPDGNFAYVSNVSTSSVSVINTTTNKVIKNIPVGSFPWGIAVSPDGSKVYVSNNSDNTISIISTATNTVTGFPISSPQFNFPVGIAFSPDGSKAYVANFGSNTVSVINTSTNTVTKQVTVGINPFAITVSAVDNKVYVVNSASNSISVIDGTTDTFLRNISTGSGPFSAAISPDGNTLYESNLTDVWVIDAKTGLTKIKIPMSSTPLDVAASVDGKLVYVTTSFSGIAVINTATNAVITTIAAGGNPQSLGNFLTKGVGCPGTPQTFQITVNPTTPIAITPGGNLSPLTTTYGTASPSTSFTVSGTNITGGILVTPPKGFEVSTDNITFSPTVTVPGTGTINNVPVYIRLTTTTPAGPYAGNIVLSSTGATDAPYAMPNSIVNPAPLTITAKDKPKPYGNTLTNVTGSTDFLPPVGLQNNEIITSVSINYGNGAASDADAGPYAQQAYLFDPVGSGGFLASNYTITYVYGTITVTPVPLTIKADDKTKYYNTPNPPLTATYSGFVNKQDPSYLSPPPDITTTATLTSPEGKYTITVSGGASQNYILTRLPGTLTISLFNPTIVPTNTFTPNGDGYNDTWEIKHIQSYPNCTVNIYNRYGEKLYSSVGYPVAWDGTYKGSYLPTGAYYYIINLHNGQKVISGEVTIIR